MKILIVCQYYPPEPFRVGDLARGLHERGHQVTVLTGFPNYPQGKLYKGFSLRLFRQDNDHGVTVWRVPLFPDTSFNRLKRILNYVSFFLSASLIGPFLVGCRYDAILTFQLSPVSMAIPSVIIRALSGFRIPIYHWVQDIWPESLEAAGLKTNPKVVGLLRKLVSFLYHQSEKVLIQSEGFRNLVLSYGIASSRIEYLPNWAEDLYQPLNPDIEFAKKESMGEGFHVVFAGNIGAAQGLETVIDAAKLLQSHSDIRFIIIGDGANLENLKSYARDVSNVELKGRKNLELMPTYFALADVLLVHLKRDPLFALTIPSKVQSYLACGRVVVAGLQGSGSEVINESEGGIVCEPENPQALCDAILKVYKMPIAERQKMSQNALNYYSTHFSRNLVLDKLQQILKRGSV